MGSKGTLLYRGGKKISVRSGRFEQFIAVLSLFLSIVIPQFAHAQPSKGDVSLESEMRRGMEFWGAESYATAETLFRQVEERALRAGADLMAGEAAYRAALCAVRLNRVDAPVQLIHFLERYPEGKRTIEARCALGNWYYREQQWEKALTWYPEQMEGNGILGQEEGMEVKFKRGYCHFMQGDYAKARPLFADVKGSNTYFSKPASYYYGHIAYHEKLYSAALVEFNSLENDPSFGALVPYYKSQILYAQGDYLGVVDYASGRVDSLQGSRAQEMHRVLADSYFRLGNFSKAKIHLDRHIAGGKNLTREDHYLAGFVHYKLKDYPQAVEYLGRVLTHEDSMSQNANYTLGDCFLQLGDKPKAQQALGMAARAHFDTLLQEEAHFAYACLTLEQPGSPFEDAVTAFSEYIKLYPWSPRLDQAYSYLGMAFVESRNYTRALEVLEKITQRSSLTRRALQRASYFRGVELFQNLRFKEAETLFTRALEYQEQDPHIRALTLYWRGETYYRQENYALAAKDWRDFQRAAGAFNMTEEFNLSYYNLGYCHYRMEQYQEGEKAFRSFAEQKENAKPMRVEGYNRAGDCRFLRSDYWPAIDYYDNGAALNDKGSDYSLYMSGISLGLVNRNAKKAERLQTLLNLWPESALRVDAYYELANLYLGMDSLREARFYYSRVVEDFPSHPKAGAAMVQLGLAHYAEEDNAKAREYLERVVRDYGDNQLRQEALTALERVYQSEGNVAGYLAFLEKNGYGARISEGARDSLYFSNAELQYMRGNFSKAKELLQAYLTDYPRGTGSTAATFYLGDCLLQLGDTTQAIGYLRQVATHGPADYKAKSIKTLAPMLEDRGQAAEALTYYQEIIRTSQEKDELLQARLGGLRCAKTLGSDSIVVPMANAVLASEEANEIDRQYALYQLAGVYMRQGKLDEAYIAYQQMGINTTRPSVAEARFRMVEVKYLQGNLADCKRDAMDFAKHNTPHQNWLARAFILLAKTYEKEGDFFQAKATLQSVLDNYRSLGPTDTVREEAAQAMEALLENERTAQTPKTSGDTIQFKFSK